MLTNPTHACNLKVFQNQWSNGQPVIVSNVSGNMNMHIWRPDSFREYFGEETVDLVDFTTGNLLQNQSIKFFWDGFECVTKRTKYQNGSSMLLKIKDWPPNEDFAVKLPEHFEDLSKSLPLVDYTKRNGAFNLVSCLPDCFAKPDLGPKMYIAYGSAMQFKTGTTNIHLDIAIPKNNIDREQYMEEVYRAMDEAGCDSQMKKYVSENNRLPGALWHIYAPNEADQIRRLLSKVSAERGINIERNHDVIHDQNWYLDGELRERLLNEYDVTGYPLVQCSGCTTSSA